MQIVFKNTTDTDVFCCVTVEVMVTVTTHVDAYVMMDGVELTAVLVSVSMISINMKRLKSGEAVNVCRLSIFKNLV